MHRMLGVAFVLAILAGCASHSEGAARASAVAVVADLLALQQQLQVSGAATTPAELAALGRAIGDAEAGAGELAGDAGQTSTVLATIETDIAALEPFLPEIAIIIGALAAPASPAAAPAPVYSAIAQLQTDMAKLRADS